jgi:hypothetical protein
MTERRYDEQEVAEIFGRATEAQHEAARQLPSGEGLTLAELQEIGRQVGVTADAVADAARSLDRREPRFRRQFLGLTVGVGRTVALERRITTDEWERLVVVLRETFDARGNVKSDGGLRQWTNGNLQVLVEPTASGDRLRLRTVHANARNLMTIGVGVLATTGLVAAITLALGIPESAERLSSLLPLAMLGAAAVGIGAARLRGWAATRMRQMDEIAARLRLTLGQGSAADPSTRE